MMLDSTHTLTSMLMRGNAFVFADAGEVRVLFMQVHEHLQAAALRFYPNRKLLVPIRSKHQMQTIRTWSSRDLQKHNFDLAQVWSLHSQSTFTTPYIVHIVLLGEPQETPKSELCKEKYHSMTFFKVDGLSK